MKESNIQLILKIDIDKEKLIKKEQRDQDPNIKSIDDIDMDFIAQLFIDYLEADEVTNEFTGEIDHEIIEGGKNGN